MLGTLPEAILPVHTVSRGFPGRGGIAASGAAWGVSLLAGFVHRPPSLPEAKASGHPITKPREWGSHTAAFRRVGKPAAPSLNTIQEGFIPWREGGVRDVFANALS
jgi:hypothetical protein